MSENFLHVSPGIGGCGPSVAHALRVNIFPQALRNLSVPDASPPSAGARLPLHAGPTKESARATPSQPRAAGRGFADEPRVGHADTRCQIKEGPRRALGFRSRLRDIRGWDCDGLALPQRDHHPSPLAARDRCAAWATQRPTNSPPDCLWSNQWVCPHTRFAN